MSDLYAYTPEFCSPDICCEDCDSCYMRHPYEPDLDMGFDPYLGCYTDDC